MSPRWTLLAMIAALLATSLAAPADNLSRPDQLGIELSKIKTLLQRLQEKAEADDKQPPPLKQATEPMTDKGKDVEDSADDTATNSDVLERLAKSLSLADLKKLQALKEIVEKEKEPREETNWEEEEPDIEVETQEGTFGPFKDEIKYSIEKNLLSDVALAVHSGIPVEEILADLIGKGTEVQEPVIWSKPVEE